MEAFKDLITAIFNGFAWIFLKLIELITWIVTGGPASIARASGTLLAIALICLKVFSKKKR